MHRELRGHKVSVAEAQRSGPVRWMNKTNSRPRHRRFAVWKTVLFNTNTYRPSEWQNLKPWCCSCSGSECNPADLQPAAARCRFWWHQKTQTQCLFCPARPQVRWRPAQCGLAVQSLSTDSPATIIRVIVNINYKVDVQSINSASPHIWKSS